MANGVTDSADLGENEDGNISSWSVSRLISSLKLTFLAKDFAKVEAVLAAREDKSKLEIETLKQLKDSFFYKSEEERLDKMSLEDELRKCKKECEEMRNTVSKLREENMVLREREKQAEGRCKNLLEEVKRIGEEEKIMIDLRSKNCELECARAKAEGELEILKQRFEELDKRVLNLEGDLPLLRDQEDLKSNEIGGENGNSENGRAKPDETLKVEEVSVGPSCDSPVKANGHSRNAVIESDPSPINVVEYNSDQLKIITNEFGENNFVTKTLFGSLFRGEIPNGWDRNGARKVTVKIWEHMQWGFPSRGKREEYVVNKKEKLMNELHFLQHPSVRGHSNLVQLIGYCCDEEEGIYAVVYDLNPLDTLHNFITKDSFYWCDRIKVALELARLLAFLHSHKLPYMVRNLDAMHIMIDKDVNPVLFDFGMLTGGIMGELKDIVEKPNIYVMGSLGYIDPEVASGIWWSPSSDVYSFGAILLSIISKRVVDKVHPQGTVMSGSKAKAAYEKEKSCCQKEAECSIVNEFLKLDPTYDARDGHVVTVLAMCCMEYCQKPRPKMKDVFKRLRSLHAVRSLEMMHPGAYCQR